MATPPDHVPPPQVDASRPVDPFTILSALARQRGSDDAHDTFETLWRVLRDIDSEPVTTRVLRTLQEMAAAGAFTPAERFYLLTELGGLLSSRRYSDNPRVHAALDELVAIEEQYGDGTHGRTLREPGASQYARVRREIESIERSELAAVLTAIGETDIAALVLQGSDEYEALRTQGHAELGGFSATAEELDPATAADRWRAFIEECSPDDLLFYLLHFKGQAQAKYIWNAYRDLPEPGDTIDDVMLLIRPLQHAARRGKFTPDERHYLLANLAERLAPRQIRMEPDRAPGGEEQAHTGTETDAESDEAWVAALLSPVLRRARKQAHEERMMAIEAEWLQSVGESEMAQLLMVDRGEYGARQGRGWTSLFGMTRSEWEAMREELRRREGK